VARALLAGMSHPDTSNIGLERQYQLVGKGVEVS